MKPETAKVLIVKKKRKKRSVVQGMSRKKLYSCCYCLVPFLEYPGVVMDNGAMVACPECSEEGT